MKSQKLIHVLSDSTNEYLSTDLISIITFSLCIPLYEFLIYPFLRNRIPRTTVRIGLGFLVALFGLSIWLAIDVAGHSSSVTPNASVCMFYNATDNDKISINPLSIISVIVIMAFAEMLIFLSTLEFIVAQSPYGMRGLILGLFFMLYGIFVGFGAILLAVFSVGFNTNFRELPISCGTSLIMAMMVIGCIGALVYFISAKLYKERQRGGQVDINYQTVLEGYYES